MICLTTERLLDAAFGHAPPELEVHLENCARCQKCLAELVDDLQPANDELRIAGEEDPFSEEECTRAVSTAERADGLETQEDSHRPWNELAQPDALDDSVLLESRYLLGEEIGRGGFGVVRAGQHTGLQREVVVKLLHAQYWSTTVEKRNANEAQALAKIKHPNVVEVYDVGRCDHHGPYLVMERLHGCSLQRLHPRGSDLPIADACEIIRQSAVGLAQVHGANLVHRDVKPANLFLTGEGIVKVLDFGLVRREMPEGDSPMTKSNHFMGTPAYASPEQWTDAHNVDERTDVYGLGGTLWYLLVGKEPPVHHSALRQFRSDVPDGLIQTLELMTTDDRENRFASCELVQKALLDFTTGHDLPGLFGESSESPECPRRIESDLDVLLVCPTSGQTISARRQGTLPVKKGVRIRIQCVLNEPMHLYLIWITSTGDPQPLYPWAPGNWQSLTEQPVRDRLSLPLTGGPTEWVVDTPAGVETLLLLGSRLPLSLECLEAMSARLGNVSRLQNLPHPELPCLLRFQKEPHQRENSELRLNFTPPAGSGQKRDPIVKFHEQLRQQLGQHCDLVHAFSFTNTGDEGGAQ